MALNSIHSNFCQSAWVNPRLHVNEGPNSGFLSTAWKASAVVLSLLASIGSFVFLGPIAGLLVTVCSGIGLFSIFDCCCGDSHNHTGGPRVPVGNGGRTPLPPPRVPEDGRGPTPWYERFFWPAPHSPSPHEPHIPVGDGRRTPSPPRRIPEDGRGPGGLRPSGPDGHVSVGRHRH